MRPRHRRFGRGLRPPTPAICWRAYTTGWRTTWSPSDHFEPTGIDPPPPPPGSSREPGEASRGSGGGSPGGRAPSTGVSAGGCAPGPPPFAPGPRRGGGGARPRGQSTTLNELALIPRPCPRELAGALGGLLGLLGGIAPRGCGLGTGVSAGGWYHGSKPAPGV